jgi:hypothetical protein
MTPSERLMLPKPPTNLLSRSRITSLGRRLAWASSQRLLTRHGPVDVEDREPRIVHKEEMRRRPALTEDAEAVPVNVNVLQCPQWDVV